MNSKKVQKGIIFSCEEVKNTIERRAHDLAVKSNQSISFIIETTLLEGLFPRNEDARSFVINGLYPENGNGSVGQTLDDIFGWNSAGVNWGSKYTNFKPLVEYCLIHVLNDSMLSEKNMVLHHFLSQFSSITEKIERIAKSDEVQVNEEMLQHHAKWARQLYELAREKPNEAWIKFFLEIINDCWDFLSDWSITYRCLSDIAAMADFTETIDARNSLVEIIDKISNEW